MSIFTKAFTSFNVAIYRISRGRLGSQLGPQSVLLLHSVGRKSGKAYITPVTYFRDGNNYLLVASNWGGEKNPDWYLNLLQQKRTTIQVKDRTLSVDAHSVEGEEYDRLWKRVTRQNAQYLQYQQKTTRRIPVVRLTPQLQ
jgi:F420H(2)-dependent quinone reductase